MSRATDNAFSYTNPQLPTMSVAQDYSAAFAFLTSTLYFFRTVLRISSKGERILRVVVVDVEGELCVYSVDGNLKRQVTISSQVTEVFADSAIIVLKILDDDDLALEFHPSRRNAADATLRRFVTVLRHFVPPTVRVNKVDAALTFTNLGSKDASSQQAGGGDTGARSFLGRKTSELWRSTFGSSDRGAKGKKDGDDNTIPDPRASGPANVSFAVSDSKKSADTIDPAFGEVVNDPTTMSGSFAPMSFKNRRDQARRSQQRSDGAVSSPAAAPSAPEPSQSLADRVARDDRRVFEQWSEGNITDTENGGGDVDFDELPLASAASPSPQRPTDRVLAAIAAANKEGEVVVTGLRQSLARLSQSNAEADIPVEELTPPRAVGFILQELRNDRVAAYLDDFVEDMNLRQRESDRLINDHLDFVDNKRKEMLERQRLLDQAMQDTEAKARQAQALAALVLAACRRRRLIGDALSSAEGEAAAIKNTIRIESLLASSAAQALPADDAPSTLDTAVGAVAIPPYLRQRALRERAFETSQYKFANSTAFAPPPSSYASMLLSAVARNQRDAPRSSSKEDPGLSFVKQQHEDANGASEAPHLTVTKYGEGLRRPYSAAVLGLI